jgi:hypothetical protein
MVKQTTNKTIYNTIFLFMIGFFKNQNQFHQQNLTNLMSRARSLRKPKRPKRPKTKTSKNMAITFMTKNPR